MTLGLVVAFFMSHRKIWVLVREENDSTRIIMAGQANKNRISFEKDIERMTAQLRESLQGENR
jgi:cytochrome c biogenesis protein